jgi:carbamoylphosphate synthase large subunit
MYSTYEAPFAGALADESQPSDREKVVILGGGPNRIGQGIEFDYCCCHACFALSDAGFETIMINCNPETVSTDYDTSDRLYFESLTAEDVIEILEREKQNGTLKGVIVQFGGQTPLKLARALEEADIPILGTSPDAIDLAEDRDRFKRLLDKLGLKQPKNGIAYSVEQARLIAGELGYPLVVRPSYVLGGRAMQIIREEGQLGDYLLGTLPELVPADVKARYPNDKTGQINTVLGKNPLLFDRYLSDAIEVDVDCLADGKTSYVAGIMEHIEEAGIHSGDSACSLPPYSLPGQMLAELERQTKALALALDVGGLMNVQYAIKDGEIYVLEVNPRASRTVPFVAKVVGEPIAKIASRIMAGESLDSFGLKPKVLDHVGVKEAVFPFARFPGVDVLLGPGDALHRRGHGPRPHLRHRLRQEPARCGDHRTRLRHGLRLGARRRQAAHPRGHPHAARPRLQDHRHLRQPALSRRAGHSLRQDQQGAGGPAAHRRRAEERRGPACLQHDGGRPGAVGLPVPAPRGPLAEGSLLHHSCRCCGRRTGHQGLSRGGPRGARAAELFRQGLISRPCRNTQESTMKVRGAGVLGPRTFIRH